MHKGFLHTSGPKLGAMAIAGAVLAVPQAYSLTIVRNFIAAGQDFGNGLGLASGPPGAGNFGGTGNLVDIFNAAADCWEASILDNHTVTLKFGWQALSGGTLGVHVLTGQGGAPHRETSGTIRFDSDGSAQFYIDGTPTINEEYTTWTAFTQNLGGGNMNVGRVMTGALGAANGRWDLFGVALHEIGHSLGLSSANTAFQTENVDLDIDVTAPRPFAGATLPTISGAHLNITNSLMFPSVNHSTRHFISHADLVANAQISQFTNLNLNGCVPEPASIAAVSLGVLALVRRRRK